MFEIIAWVAKSIGDSNTTEFFPVARNVIRQAALDGSITIRGCKSGGLMGEGGYSRMQTEIPKEYWDTAEIGVLATSEESRDTPPHTFPHQFSSGKFGDLIFLYGELHAKWAEIAKKWPV